jgi:deoxyribodipyrimidine photo-lyase
MKLALFHHEMLNPEHPVLQSHLSHQPVFVFDPDLLHTQGWPLMRVQFVADCVAEIPRIRVFHGSLAEVCAAVQATEIVTQESPDPTLRAWIDAATTPNNTKVEWLPEPRFVDYAGSLARFSHYWYKVEHQWFPKSRGTN